jgi:protease YdgD
VRSNRIAPIPTGRRAVRGLEVTVVSYGARREAHASIEEGCRVLEGAEDVRVLSCRVVQGSSGSPVMRIVDGVPEIVAVISASATDRQGAELSMAVALDRHVAALLGQLDGGTEAHGSRFDTLSGDGGRSQIGARFIRP